MEHKEGILYQYGTQIGGIMITTSWWGLSPFRFIDSGKEVSKKQLRELTEKAGGVKEIYKICLDKKITWLEYLGIREKTEEEKKKEAESFKDWTF
ncbi:MAG: hypothetical protein K6G50_00715 [bacterium]|nr:hypothetical protein [bacterium]